MMQLLPGREVYTCDVDTISQGAITQLIINGKLPGNSIIYLHGLIIDYLLRLSNEGKASAIAALEEIRRATKEASKRGIQIVITPIKSAHLEDVASELSEAVIELTRENDATLITSSDVLATIAESMGLKVLRIKKEKPPRLKLEEFFGDNTMSVHLIEGIPPFAKVGRPGEWQFTIIRQEPLRQEEIESIVEEIISEARARKDAFIEIDRMGSTIVQLGRYRIVISRPPLSSRWEITAVRPLVKLSLSDYNLPEKLIKRLEEKAEGILIAGAPGMGKTTFAQALAEHYAKKGKVVKTIESPRDMVLPPEVVQYSKNFAEKDELHDILLLSRPDYTFFDELRGDDDFRLYVDLRLAGIGMVGVLHATSPIDAIQRFIGRVELGMIPSIIDTVIFIDKGKVSKVYEVGITVKLPTGLKEAELSRPVVEVRDFITEELEYEIYTFGEQTVVIPVKKEKKRVDTRLKSQLESLIPNGEIEFVGSNQILVKVPRDVAKLITKRARRLRKLAEKYGYELRFEME
jgi:ATPase